MSVINPFCGTFAMQFVTCKSDASLYSINMETNWLILLSRTHTILR